MGCPVDCGSFGRCVAANSSSAAPRARRGYACECECGWAVDGATGRCDVPAGTCPLFPAGGGAAAMLMLEGGNGSRSVGGGDACAGGDAVAATGGSCPAKYGFDIASKTCKRCEAEGWGGVGCRQCTTDDACKVRACLRGGVPRLRAADAGARLAPTSELRAPPVRC